MFLRWILPTALPKAARTTADQARNHLLRGVSTSGARPYYHGHGHGGGHGGVVADRPPNVSEEGKRSIARAIYNSHRDPRTETLQVGKITDAIRKTGIRDSDPRLRSLFLGLRDLRRQVGESRVTIENLQLDFRTFSALVDDNLSILSQIFCNTLVVPEFEKFSQHIRGIFDHCKSNESGKVADYIPQLAKCSKDTWACSVCTVDGQRLSLGDCHQKFTLQSIRYMSQNFFQLQTVQCESNFLHVSKTSHVACFVSWRGSWELALHSVFLCSENNNGFVFSQQTLHLRHLP